MIPVLYTFLFTSGLAQAVLYALAVGLVGYSAWNGWSGAVGPLDPKTGHPTAPSQQERLQRALGYGAAGAAVAYFGLHYALPADMPFGGKGEGIPVHTYGVMMALGFLSAVTVAGRLAYQEWRGTAPVHPEVVRYLEAANAALKAGRELPAVPAPVRDYQPYFQRAKDGTLSLPALFSLEGQKKKEQVMDLTFWVLIGGIGGAKLLFILVNWTEYGHTFAAMGRALGRLDLAAVGGEVWRMLSGGLVFYGGLIGASLMAFWWSRRNHIDFLRLADVAIPTVSLGQAFGRLGCFSAGCCWGGVTRADHPVGVHFPGSGLVREILGNGGTTPSLAFSSMREDSRWVVEATGEIFHQAVPGAVRISDWVAQHGHTLPVYPTQVFESVGQVIFFVGLVFLRRYRRFHGQILALWLMAYALLRSTNELFRGDVERGTLHGLLNSLGAQGLAEAVPLEAWYNISTSQFISLAMFALGATLLVRKGRQVSAGAAAPPAGATPAGA